MEIRLVLSREQAAPKNSLLSQIERALEGALDSLDQKIAKQHQREITRVVELAYERPSQSVLGAVEKLAQSLRDGPKQVASSLRATIKRLEQIIGKS